MSIWCDGTDLNVYRGDSFSIIFSGLPCCSGYRVYFSVKSTKSDTIIFESSGDPVFYYLNNEGEEYQKLPTETEAEFIARMEALVESGDAIKKGRCKIFVSADKTEQLFVLKNKPLAEYCYGLKICFSATGVENTIIPETQIVEETGEIIFKDPPKFIVRPKYVEGILPCDDYEDFDYAKQDPKDYGLQPLLTPVYPLQVDKKNNLLIDMDVMSLNLLADVEITDLQDGDSLIFNARKGKWINKHQTEEDVDGGDPGTQYFDSIADNGDPSTNSFDNIIDGENP